MISSTSKRYAISCFLRLQKPEAVEVRDGWAAGILGSETVNPESAAGQPLHVVLANLPDDEKAHENFIRKYGPFTLSKTNLQVLALFEGANVGPAVEALQARPQVKALLEQKQSEKGPPSSRFFSESLGSIIQQRDMLRKAWKGDAGGLWFLNQYVALLYDSAWKFSGGKIEIVPGSSWLVACILFLRDYAAGKAAICANPECPARYFIKKRETQRFCEEGSCAVFGRRESNRRWWDTTGKKRREQQRKKAQNRRRKKQ